MQSTRKQKGLCNLKTINKIGRLLNSTSWKSVDVQSLNVEIKEEVVKTRVQDKDIFEDIVGHDSIKVIFQNAIVSKEQVHILLTGAPGTAKSLFLEAVSANVDNSSLITNNSTGAGMLTMLYEKPDLEYLLIDEIEKIGKIEQSVLLTLMENGRLIVTKATMTCNREQKVRIFATCNCVDKLAPEMRSRFLRFFLKPYTYLEFVTIVAGLAINKYDNTREFAEKVAHNVWFEMGSKDVRDCIKIMKLCKNIEQIDIIAKALKEYSEFGNESGV